MPPPSTCRMSLSTDSLSKAAQLLQWERVGDDTSASVVYRGAFVQYASDLHIAIAMGAAQAKAVELRSTFMAVQDDLWALTTVVHKLEWMRFEALEGHLPGSLWMSFAGTDFEHFHVDLRSLMDHIALAAGIASRSAGQVPTSFRKLVTYAQTPTGRKRLGVDLAALVGQAPWFMDARRIRDSTVHEGAKALAFGSPSDGILYQVLSTDHRGGLVRVEKAIAWNEYVVDFRR